MKSEESRTKKAAKKITLKDIALLTGYTVNTISHALQDKEDISQGTKKKIRQIAENLGYVRNSLASSLRTGFSKSIAVIMGDISNPYFGIMVKHIEHHCQKKGYNVFIINTDEDLILERRAIQSALEKDVDGVIICPTQQSSESIDLLVSSRCPFVLSGRSYPNHDFVICDDQKGGLLATEFLIKKGCKKILFLNGARHITSAHERYAGYRAALAKNKIAFSQELVQETSITTGNCKDVYSKLKKNHTDFDGVFAFSDLLALEFLSVLRENDNSVFLTLPVIGFDNILSNFSIPYPLSSIEYNKETMAQLLVDTLINKIINRNTSPVQLAIQPYIIERL